jgi:O-antigen ligase
VTVLGLTCLADNPLGVLRDLSKTTTPIALAVALPVLLPTTRRIALMLNSLAVAITLIAAWDLIRIGSALGRAAWGQARFYQPYLLNHPNVASMMAGVALLILIIPLFMQAWSWRSLLWRLGPMAILASYLLILASRGPQLAFGGTVVLCGLLLPGWRAKTGWFSCMVILGILVSANIATINPRFAEKNSMSNFSERTFVWQHTWELSKQHWLTGYGYGKKTFQQVYYSSKPPTSRFTYPHCHQYWLAQFFHTGAIGTVLLALAWGALGAGLIRALTGPPSAIPMLRPLLGTILMIAVFIHAYGLGDYPDSVVSNLLLWIPGVGVALLGIAHKKGPAPL